MNIRQTKGKQHTYKDGKVNDSETIGSFNCEIRVDDTVLRRVRGHRCCGSRMENGAGDFTGMSIETRSCFAEKHSDSSSDVTVPRRRSCKAFGGPHAFA